MGKHISAKCGDIFKTLIWASRNISLHCDCLPRWHLSPQKEVKLFVKEISRMPQIRFPSMTFWWPGTPYCLTQWGNFTLHLAQFLGGKFKYLSSHFIGPIVLSVTVSIYFGKKTKAVGKLFVTLFYDTMEKLGAVHKRRRNFFDRFLYPPPHFV